MKLLSGIAVLSITLLAAGCGDGNSQNNDTSTDTTKPSVRITAPTNEATHTTSDPTINIAGTADDNVSVSEVVWSCDTGCSDRGTANGTTSWSSTDINLADGINRIVVTASDGANNTGTDSITITYRPQPAPIDTVEPVVSIDTPTADSTYSTSMTTVALAGTANDNVSVSEVAWSCTSGCSGSGVATGTTSWSTSTIDLAVGDNQITITATDSSANTATDSITVTLTPAVTPSPNPGVFFSEDFESNTFTTFNSAWYNTMADNPNYSIQSDNVANGVYTLKFDYHQNEDADSDFATQHFGDSTKTPVYSEGAGNTYDELYLQYKVYYSPGFDFSSGNNKQFIIGTEDGARHANACCNPWVAHYVTLAARSDGIFDAEANNKQGASGQWVDLSPNLNGYNNTNSYAIETGRWYTVEAHIRLNDANQTNGVFEQWIDGEKITERRNITYRIPINGYFGTDFNHGINFLMLSNYINNPASQDQSSYYDDIKLSTSYIGIGDPTPPPADTTDPVVEIISPTTDTSFSTSTSTVSLSGRASDNQAVSSVAWSCTSGCEGRGNAEGTTSWSVNGINLSEGSNVISVTATDSSDNQGTDSITINYTPLVDPPVVPTDDNPDDLPLATTRYAEPSHFKQASDISNIWQNDAVMTYEFLPHGGLLGDGAFKATPASGTHQNNTGWNIPNLSLADNSREPLFVSAVYYFSREWAPAIGRGVKNIDFQLYDPEYPFENHANTRVISGLSDAGDMPRFDGRRGVRFELNRGGAGWGFSGRSYGTDSGLFLEDVAGMWFWLGYYIDFENNRVSAYVKTGPEGPYPNVTRVLHRTNNNLLLGSDLHDHPWVRGETITGQTSGATAIVDDYGYDGLIITPISGNFADQYDVSNNGAEGELIVGSESGAWSGRVAAENWNWDRTSAGLNVPASRNINGYWKVDASTPKTTDMYHIVDQVAVGNGWINPPAFPASAPQ
jgi:hypothetical protein